MVLYKFTNSTTADALQVDDNFNKCLIETSRSLINYNKINQLQTNKVVFDSSANSVFFDFDSSADLSGSYNTDVLYSGAYSWYSNGLRLIYNGIIYDNYSDGSIDSTKWTTVGTTPTESANSSINVTKSGAGASTSDTSIISYGSSNRLDIKPSGASSEIILSYYGYGQGSSSGQNASSNAYLQIVGSTSGSVTIAGVTGPGTSPSTSTISGTVKIRIVGTTAYFLVNDTTAHTFIEQTADLSSLTGTYWYVKISAHGQDESGGGSSTSNCKLYPLVYVNNSTVTNADIYTVAQTVASSSSGFVYDDGLNVAARNLSVNGGSNYVSVSNGTINALTTGTSAKIKYTLGGSNCIRMPQIGNTVFYTSGD